MNENIFRNEICQKLKEQLPNYEILEKANLLYKIFVDTDGFYSPQDPKNLKRGSGSFQTDILIRENKIPLVVIETKFKSCSTHEILVYSMKGIKHKEIYPYLRYGLLIGEKKVVNNRFFTHNSGHVSGFDFAFAIENLDDKNIDKLVGIIKSQIKNANQLLSIIREKNNVVSFNTIIKIDWKIKK